MMAMARPVRSPSRRVAGVGAMALVGVLVVGIPARAQSPGPNHHFYAVGVSSYDPSHAGVVVEALGMGSCDPRLSGAETMTVQYIDNDIPVWTEITPQDYCGSVSYYKGVAQTLANYVETYANQTKASKYWAGLMMDEEDGYGFTVSQLASINTGVQNVMDGTLGVSWWSLEGFVGNGSHPDGCDWTHSDYSSVLQQGWQAQQIVHQCNANLVDYGATDTAVTWNANYPAPGESESSASGAVSTAAYHVVLGQYAYYWSNHWVAT